MYSISLLLLLAGINFPDGTQGAKDRLSRRQSSSPVELWGACNYPSQGINGPLPCASGGECICKDESKCKTILRFRSARASRNLLLMTLTAYAQCRKQIEGSWAPDPSWQCQQPGSSASGSSNSNTPSTGGTSSGSGAGSDLANQDTSSQDTNSGGGSTPSTGSTKSSGSGSSQAATIGDCTTASAPGGWDGVASTSVSLW